MRQSHWNLAGDGFALVAIGIGWPIHGWALGALLVCLAGLATCNYCAGKQSVLDLLP